MCIATIGKPVVIRKKYNTSEQLLNRSTSVNQDVVCMLNDNLQKVRLNKQRISIYDMKVIVNVNQNTCLCNNGNLIYQLNKI